MDYFLLLPLDVILSIILLCSINDILKLSCVNHLFESAINETFWKKMLLTTNPLTEYPVLWKDIVLKEKKGELKWKGLCIMFSRENIKVISVIKPSIVNSLTIGHILLSEEDTLQTIFNNIFRLYGNTLPMIKDTHYRFVNNKMTTPDYQCNMFDTLVSPLYELACQNLHRLSKRIEKYCFNYDETDSICLSSNKIYRLRLLVNNISPLLSLDDLTNGSKKEYIEIWFDDNITLNEFIVIINRQYSGATSITIEDSIMWLNQRYNNVTVRSAIKCFGLNELQGWLNFY